jgi:serine/threonine protein kinase
MPYTDYTLLSKLQHGGTSAVYKVRDIDTEEIRVMKITPFKDVYKTAWLNEVKMLTQFQYVRGVVKMYEYGEIEEHGYIVLELCDKDLFEDPIKPSEIKQVFLFLYNVLTTIHSMGYCYCDLKPENVLRKNKGYRLCDFTSCQPIGTISNVLYGTPHVLAPELLKHVNSENIQNGFSVHPTVNYYYDEKIDTWGLGCMMYEIILHEAFDIKKMNEKLTTLTNPQLKELITLCLNVDPLQRLRIWELSKKMKDLKMQTFYGLPNSSHPNPPPSRVDPQKKKRQKR